jgi:small subunit ribosomal protein S4
LARYRESVCKLCRNEGQKLYLKGSRCDTPKCAISRRSYGSGQHGNARKKLSEFAVQLREKQKLRRTYGILEKPFRRNYETAIRLRGVTGTLMLQRLEARFDNVVYRSGLVPSRALGRQMIQHGHFIVNGHKVDIPSYLIKPGDVITVRERSKGVFTALLEGRSPTTPHWMELDASKLSLVYKQEPERADLDQSVKELLITEYYSR